MSKGNWKRTNRKNVRRESPATDIRLGGPISSEEIEDLGAIIIAPGATFMGVNQGGRGGMCVEDVRQIAPQVVDAVRYCTKNSKETYVRVTDGEEYLVHVDTNGYVGLGCTLDRGFRKTNSLKNLVDGERE